jgi:Na+-transporting NADH:ubiquinone oxidoreductase subunit NqrF
LNIADVSGSFYWETEYYHNDNAFTMNDFLENYLPDNAEITLDDGSYAEIEMEGNKFSLDAKGNGDSFHHCVDWHVLR